MGVYERELRKVSIEKTLPLIFAVVCCLLLSVSGLAQPSTKTEADQKRSVKGRVLTSTYLPPIRVRFDKKFKYIGSQKFILYDRAQVEQHFFVDADDQKLIKRMYMVQFEGYLPNVDAVYDYPAAKTVDLGGLTYIVNTETISNVPAALSQDPKSDVARAGSFLAGKGYRISDSIMYQRFVRLLDEAKRNEFILLYIENAGAVATSENEKALQDFSSRSLRGFTILK